MHTHTGHRIPSTPNAAVYHSQQQQWGIRFTRTDLLMVSCKRIYYGGFRTARNKLRESSRKSCVSRFPLPSSSFNAPKESFSPNCTMLGSSNAQSRLDTSTLRYFNALIRNCRPSAEGSFQCHAAGQGWSGTFYRHFWTPATSSTV